MSPPNPTAKIITCKNKRDQYELIDYNYLDQLSPDELQFLADFTQEFYEGKGSGRGRRRNDNYTLKRTSAPEPIDHFTPEDILIANEEYQKYISTKHPK